MPSTKGKNEPSHVTTGNVLEDLGFSQEEIREIEIQHDLWVPIRAEIEARRLTQAQVAKVLQIHQPDASLLIRGRIARFSITRLMQFAERLNLAVSVGVTPKAAQTTPRIPMRKTTLHRIKRKTAVGSRTAKKAIA
jgi:predicted XRE-type DNA-binding protein